MVDFVSIFLRLLDIMISKSCIFCNIIERKLPAEILFEDEYSLAILDVHPIHYGHSLIIPKHHCNSFLDVPEEMYHSIFYSASLVTRALVETYQLEGYNLFSNNGTVAGQSIFHFHLHITPRYENDNIKFLLSLKKYQDGELEQTAEELRKAIQSILQEHKSYDEI